MSTIRLILLSLGMISCSCIEGPVSQVLGQSVDWIRDIGFLPLISDISADRNGNLTVVGLPNVAGGRFIRRLDHDGNDLGHWNDSPIHPGHPSYGVAIDALGNNFVVSTERYSTPNTYLLENFDSNGMVKWGFPLPHIGAVAADGQGNVYISRVKSLNESPLSYVVEKYNSAGGLVWNRDLGTGSYVPSFSVSADLLGNVFAIYQGYDFSRLTKFDAAGNKRWHEDRSRLNDEMIHREVSADGVGNVYVLGHTAGVDSFVQKYDAAGVLKWSQPFFGLNSTNDPIAAALSADQLGNVYVLGGSQVRKANTLLDRAPGSGTLMLNAGDEPITGPPLPK